MAYSESLAQQVRAILATELPPHVFEEEVEEKKMFGGLAFMVRGKMTVTVSSRGQELVMVRIGKEMEKQVLPKNGASVTLMRGRLYRFRWRRTKGTVLLDQASFSLQSGVEPIV